MAHKGGRDLAREYLMRRKPKGNCAECGSTLGKFRSVVCSDKCSRLRRNFICKVKYNKKSHGIKGRLNVLENARKYSAKRRAAVFAMINLGLIPRKGAWRGGYNNAYRAAK